MSRVSARAQADAELATQIARVHEASRRTYGAPRARAALRARGAVCGRRVARFMRGWSGRPRAGGVPAPPAPNLVARAFAAPAPGRLWLGDSTDVPT